MPKRYQISEEQVAELEALRKRNRNKNVEKRINTPQFLHFPLSQAVGYDIM